MPITAREVERRTEVTEPVTVASPPGTVMAEKTEVREKPATVVEEVRPVTETRPSTARRPETTGGPSIRHLSAADLQVYLKGMDYPAGRQDLITHARKNDAPESVITALERFSERTYRSAADASTEFGKVK
jgi:hypothetical protein